MPERGAEADVTPVQEHPVLKLPTDRPIESRIAPSFAMASGGRRWLELEAVVGSSEPMSNTTPP